MSSKDPLIGKQLGDYKIISLLGKGGMARVYRGFDEKLHRAVAIKVFDAAIGGTTAEMEEYRERFSREARAIARLRHPHIVDVYRASQVDNINYIAMMFIDGRDLRHILKEHNANNTRMKPAEILRIIMDVASALDYAHANGVIHRDIKPSNIMVMEDGHAILTDFGLALNVPEGTIGTTFGSVHYIAPEQAVSSAQAVPQSDIYSLGVVLYEMLTGKVPFDDPSIMSVALKHINDIPLPPGDLNPQLPSAVSAVVLRVLEKSPDDRYRTAAEMVQALETAMGITDEDEMTRILPSEKPILDQYINARPAISSSRPMMAASIETATISQARRTLPLLSEDEPKKRRRFWSFIFPVLFIALIIGGTVILSQLAGERQFNDDQMTAIAMQAEETQVLIAPTDELPDPPATETPEVIATASATLTPTGTATATLTSLAEAETPSEPTQEPTTESLPIVSGGGDAPEGTATEETPNADAPVLFRYDDRSFTVWNRSDAEADVSGLTFVQILEDGQELDYRANLWAVNNGPPYALSAADCLQIWTYDDLTMAAPAYCETRLAWRRVAPSREFWRSENTGASFEVRRGSTVLIVCEISAGECAFDPAADADS